MQVQLITPKGRATKIHAGDKIAITTSGEIVMLRPRKRDKDEYLAYRDSWDGKITLYSTQEKFLDHIRAISIATGLAWTPSQVSGCPLSFQMVRPEKK